MGVDLSEVFGPEKPEPKLEPTLKNIVGIVYKDSTIDNGPWIAGGMPRQILLGESDFSDIDVWFNNKYQQEKIYQDLDNAFGRVMYEVFSSENACTYQIGDYKVQLIKRSFYKNINDVFDSFDFTCCQIAIDHELVPYGPGISDAKHYQLKLNKFDGKAFLARYAKYVGYGYEMNPQEFIKIIENPEINYEFDGSVLGY